MSTAETFALLEAAQSGDEEAGERAENLVLVEGLRFHRALRVDAAHNTVHVLLRRLPILLLALLGRIPHHAI